MRGELDWIVMKALEKDRNRRYETANGLAADLRRYLDDEPVEACPPSARYKLSKFLRRYRLPLRVAAAFVLLLLLGTAVSTWLAVRAQAARKRAVTAEALARDERDHAEKARALADRNFQKARAAVENYLQKVTDNPDLKNRGGFHDLRKQLLAAALPFFEEFVKENSDDPALRSTRAGPTFDWPRCGPRWANERRRCGITPRPGTSLQAWRLTFPSSGNTVRKWREA